LKSSVNMPFEQSYTRRTRAQISGVISTPASRQRRHARILSFQDVLVLIDQFSRICHQRSILMTVHDLIHRFAGIHEGTGGERPPKLAPAYELLALDDPAA